MSSHVVAVYEINRQYGGPEEGGWWYDAGELARIVRVYCSEEAARAYCRRLNDRLKSRTIGPNTERRELSSVLSEGEYHAEVWEDTAPASYPDGRPHYE